jgi:hypothetical protein
MNRAKIFIAFTFVLAFAVCVSAQERTPKIIWKNVQEKYESFYDINPTIVNVSNQPIYFDCSPPDLGDGDKDFKLLQFYEETKSYIWNVMVCGTMPEKMRKEQEKARKEVAKLKKKGKYVGNSCKLDPNDQFSFSFTKEQWNYLIWGDGSIGSYKSGKFIFTVRFESQYAYETTSSKEFFVNPK